MNELKHLTEFQDLLADYAISKHGKTVLSQIKLAVLLAPSSTGRNTIIRELVKKGSYRFIVSDTTRKPRVNDGILEIDGIEYWFRTEEDFLTDIKAGEMLEAEVIHEQQVSGVSIRELEKILTTGMTGITDIDLAGVQNILKLKPDAFAFLVLPPHFDEWIKRLRGRGQMKDVELARRLRTAMRIFEYAPSEPRLKLVINDSLDDATSSIDGIINSVSSTTENTVTNQELLNHLTDRTRALLSELTG